jgi:hypothetical protein
MVKTRVTMAKNPVSLAGLGKGPFGRCIATCEGHLLIEPRSRAVVQHWPDATPVTNSTGFANFRPAANSKDKL